MGSLLSKEVFCLSLCLITLFSLASCASSPERALAEETGVKRAPPGDSRVGNNKIVSRQYAADRN